ncbi:ATPase [Nitrosococcus oceani ATCC 19707]|uniref:ATPase n=2 Tax=Nitrosococcus oceani TaxID=1229 RepID=Q3J9L9_NITOC|nr:XrtA/PEP-CTERM system-associated ATPase [Nitrosococcus oceani]ABA58477.1 ATPase [Nitrosococcus oceani ATCC 19707]EDZ68162.1 putative secretion ATPase, PEP-CTERM locus subfamily [Nitrosococcus oceani AFC27]KFI19080.1 ATPase [Nitrosococcus oceani C-27]GEM18872.1 ATPase [Nitrosococcus oceani]
MYQNFYALTGKPFQLSSDPRFFYGSTVHKRALSYLRYGLMQGEGFIVITGPIGTGKTMLARTLVSELTDNNTVAAQVVTTQLEANDTLRIVAASYGLPHEGVTKAALLKTIECFLLERAQEGKQVLLLVDEAQNLPPESIEELRMLSNFQVGERALLQCFLLGQEEFRRTLALENMEQLRQRIIAAYHLNTLDRDETQGYIEHRLKLVGWNADPAIADEAYDAIHEHTGGLPRRINSLCDRLLLYSYVEESHTIDEQAVNTVASEIAEESSHIRGKTEIQGETKIPVEKSSPDMENRLIQLEETVAALKKIIDRFAGEDQSDPPPSLELRRISTGSKE